jgi:hypothetical protein
VQIIPNKIRKPNTVQLKKTQGGLSPSLVKRERENRRANLRFGVSIFLFAFALTGLVAGGIGGFVNEASAQQADRNTYWREWLFGNNRENDNRQSNQNRNQEQNREQTKETAPAETTPTQPATPVETTPTPSTPTVTTPATAAFAPVVPQIAESPVEVIPNTAPEIAATTSAQAAVESKPVTYTSQQISIDTRNQLFTAATVAIASGIIIYILSLFGTSGAALTNANPARIRIPVREATA